MSRSGFPGLAALNGCCPLRECAGRLALAQVHLFDIDIPGKITFKESLTLAPGEGLTVVDTEVGRWVLSAAGTLRKLAFGSLQLCTRAVTSTPVFCSAGRVQQAPCGEGGACHGAADYCVGMPWARRNPLHAGAEECRVWNFSAYGRTVLGSLEGGSWQQALLGASGRLA
jgi:hypothetical protein